MRRRLIGAALVACSPNATPTLTEIPIDPGVVAEDCKTDVAPAAPVPRNPACLPPAVTSWLEPTVEWSVTGRAALGPTVVGDLDGDGRPELLSLRRNFSGLECLDGATGDVKWTSWAGTNPFGAAAIGDVDGDGVPEIVVSAGTDEIRLLDASGAEIWTTAVDNQRVAFHYPSIADLDGDGMAEIVIGRVILDAHGTVLGTGEHGVGSVPGRTAGRDGVASVAVDLDGDGQLEVVVGNAAYRIDGTALYTNGLDDGVVAVADFDLDGAPELVSSTRNRVVPLESDLTPVGWHVAFDATEFASPAAIADLDLDGDPDFVAAGATEVRAYDWSGTMLWSSPTADASGAATPLLFDVDGDGYPEVIYADETHLRILSGLDGTPRYATDDWSSPTGLELPVVADVDGDGAAEIVLAEPNGAGGIRVLGGGAAPFPPARPVFNQLAYTGTNVGDDLSIPTPQTDHWTLHNGFHWVPGTAAPAGLPDAAVEIVSACTGDCPQRLSWEVRVRNEGAAPLPAGVVISVHAGRDGSVLEAAALGDGIPAGRASPGVRLEIDATALRGRLPWVAISRDGEDCSAANDAAPAPSCGQR